jgi:hypothetical protein
VNLLFDMDFSQEHTIDLLRSARSTAELSRMDRGDMYSLIAELADRLEAVYVRELGGVG